MKSIQSRLQSRISKRSTLITYIEQDRLILKAAQDYEGLRQCNSLLKDLRDEQTLDKNILSNIFWGL